MRQFPEPEASTGAVRPPAIGDAQAGVGRQEAAPSVEARTGVEVSTREARRLPGALSRTGWTATVATRGHSRDPFTISRIACNCCSLAVQVSGENELNDSCHSGFVPLKNTSFSLSRCAILLDMTIGYYIKVLARGCTKSWEDPFVNSHPFDTEFHITREQKENFQRDGFVKLKGFLNADVVDTLLNRVEVEMSRGSSVNIKGDSRFTRANYDFETERTEVYELMERPFFQRSLTDLVEHDLFLTFELCFEIEKNVSKGFP